MHMKTRATPTLVSRCCSAARASVSTAAARASPYVRRQTRGRRKSTLSDVLTSPDPRRGQPLRIHTSRVRRRTWSARDPQTRAPVWPAQVWPSRRAHAQHHSTEASCEGGGRGGGGRATRDGRLCSTDQVWAWWEWGPGHQWRIGKALLRPPPAHAQPGAAASLCASRTAIAWTRSAGASTSPTATRAMCSGRYHRCRKARNWGTAEGLSVPRAVVPLVLQRSVPARAARTG
jgi:hypothetical protein